MLGKPVAVASAMVVALLALVCLPAVAHNFTTTEVLVVLKTDGTWQADVTVDVDALALGVSQSAPSEEVVAALEALSVAEFEAGVERARDTIQRSILQIWSLRSATGMNRAAGTGRPSLPGSRSRV